MILHSKKCKNHFLIIVTISIALILIPLFYFSKIKLHNISNNDTVYTDEQMYNGAILHTFCWNFNTIKDNLPKIAAAGYTAIQTSPINQCLDTEPGLTLYSEEGKWYYHYQPTDWVIGNYQLGTKEEFESLCAEANKYGISIIVDIDPNHTTPDIDEISDDLLDAVGGIDNLYHINGLDTSISMDYSNRNSITYDPMGGLPDVDTENEDFQNYFYKYVVDCIDCGADGFRIDTAKHIALSDDSVPDEYSDCTRNSFYPNLIKYINENSSIKYDDLFVYGEVLQGDNDRLAAYQNIIGCTTASNYGEALRTAVSSGNVAKKKIKNYKIEDDTSTETAYICDASKLVTWVESHDNYINDKSYELIDDSDVVLAWGIIGARKDGRPLFFSRPDGASQDNPWGNNVLGAKGSDLYLNPQVVAVNKFRLDMVGQPESLINPSGNNSVLMIERGDIGAVIINASEDDFILDCESNLSDGKYDNLVEGTNEEYNVSKGKISGIIPARTVVVIEK